MLGQLLGDYLSSHPMPGQLIVPVPLHRKRLRSRGYNQATLLAQELSKLTNMPLDSGLLARRQDALPQVQTSGSTERRRSSFDLGVGPGERILTTFPGALARMLRSHPGLRPG